MPRIPLAESMPDELGERFAAATDGRQPPLNLHTQIGLAVYVDRFVSYADTPFDVPAAATQAA